jgi:hypothetical protein
LFICYEMNAWTVMANTSTNINKTNNHQSLNTTKDNDIWRQKYRSCRGTDKHDVGNTGPVMGQTNMTSEIQVLAWDKQTWRRKYRSCRGTDKHDVGNTGSVVGQTNMTSEIQVLSWDRQTYFVDKLVNEMSTLCIFIVVIYIERQEIH